MHNASGKYHVFKNFVLMILENYFFHAKFHIVSATICSHESLLIILFVVYFSIFLFIFVILTSRHSLILIFISTTNRDDIQTQFLLRSRRDFNFPLKSEYNFKSRIKSQAHRRITKTCFHKLAKMFQWEIICWENHIFFGLCLSISTLFSILLF